MPTERRLLAEAGWEDRDGDGVPDSDDRCLNTPKGVTVNRDGCPRDGDFDGVPDLLEVA